MGRTALGIGKDERHVVITGAMGVGKTTVGLLLASELGLAFLDSDAYLEEKTGQTGSEIAMQDGVEILHQLELEVFLLMSRSPGPAVIAPAASVVDHESGRQALEENFTVWLTAPDDVLAERRGGGAHRRQMAEEERAALKKRRGPLLQELCDITLDTGTRTPAQVVEELIRVLPESLRVDTSG